MNWEPLPPREVSSRQQRRRARALMTGASPSSLSDNTAASVPSSTSCNDNTHDDEGEDWGSKNVKENPPPVKRKLNRPGFNSYLKVILDDATMDRLHGVAVTIQKMVQELEIVSHNNDEMSQDGEANDTQKVAKSADEQKDQETQEQSKISTSNKKKKPIRFKPRSRASLHMTFFFGGETLCELPAQELIEWHGKVGARLKQSYFVLGRTPEPENEKEGNIEHHEKSSDWKNVDDYWFDVTGICMFPPKRNNLIVAILKASPAWHELHDDVRDITKTCDSSALKEITAYSKDEWTAHITLGNIFGGGSKGEIRKTFDKVLGEICKDLLSVQEEHEAEPQNVVSVSSEGDSRGDDKEDKSGLPNNDKQPLFKARTHGIAIGGPVPKQADLDWNFTYDPLLRNNINDA